MADAWESVIIYKVKDVKILGITYFNTNNIREENYIEVKVVYFDPYLKKYKDQNCFYMNPNKTTKMYFDLDLVHIDLKIITHKVLKQALLIFPKFYYIKAKSRTRKLKKEIPEETQKKIRRQILYLK